MENFNELILVEKTKQELGYDPTTLTHGSNKFIWHKCPVCKEPKLTKYASFVLGHRQTHNDKCREKLILERGSGFHPTQRQETKDNAVKTFNEKYGGHPARNEKVKEKKKQTMLEKHGVVNPGQMENHVEKMKKANMERFSAEYPMQSEEVRARAVNTHIENYGVEHPMLNEDVKNRVIKTVSERYNGHRTYLTTPESREKLKYYNDHYGETKDFWLAQKLSGCILNPNQLLPDIWPKGTDRSFEIICSCGEIFKPMFHDFVRGHSRSCGHNSSTSVAEQEIFTVVKDEFNIECINRHKQDGYEFDIFIPQSYNNEKVCIEHNGAIWHGEVFAKDVLGDYKKYLYCKNNVIRYVGIFDDEWINEKDRIINYLKNMLGVAESSIYTVRPQELNIVFENHTTDGVKEFLSHYHYLSETANSNFVWKCYYENVLIGVMCIGKPTRQGIKEEYELKRVCRHPNYKCYGLWSFLLENYVKPKLGACEITSFSDNRRDTGNLYRKLGFTEVKNLRPDYFWCKAGKREHKSNYRKNDEEKLTGLTEVQLRHAQHMFRVWDCGKTKWNFKIT